LNKNQILGFDVAGAPILPLASGPVDLDVLRRERLGWEEISHRSAKIVTFIGRSPLSLDIFSSSRSIRPGWP
jgi:hypothetical protein